MSTLDRGGNRFRILMTVDHPTLATHTDKTPRPGKPMMIDAGEVCEIIRKHGYQESSLIRMLQNIQARMDFLPRKALVQLSEDLDIPLTRIYAISGEREEPHRLDLDKCVKCGACRDVCKFDAVSVT